MLRKAADASAGLPEEDWFETILTTRGYLSRGVSYTTTLHGGIGNDGFTIYADMGTLYLYGDEDNDTFRGLSLVKVDPDDPKARSI